MSVDRGRALLEPGHERLSFARQCELVSISRPSFYYQPAGDTLQNLALMCSIDAQFAQPPWYGSQFVPAGVMTAGLTRGKTSTAISSIACFSGASGGRFVVAGGTDQDVIGRCKSFLTVGSRPWRPRRISFDDVLTSIERDMLPERLKAVETPPLEWAAGLQIRPASARGETLRSTAAIASLTARDLVHVERGAGGWRASFTSAEAAALRVFFQQQTANFRIRYPRLYHELGLAYLLPKRGRRKT